MKTELKAKFLQHILDKKKGDEGFTLIELLVVIIIIGILSAIALPSFLNQANKAKQSEAKTYIGSMNRAQQAYYLENTAFTSSIGALGLGIATSTINYQYQIAYTTGNSVATNQAQVKNTNAPLKSYVGGVEVTSQAATSEATTIAVLCESADTVLAGGTNAVAATAFVFTAGSLDCTANTGIGAGKFISLAK
ncbi:type IV pilin-like G/H family protein [Nostoc sp. 'Lobaria pulmonaria (5183) cyanobiont']|uniref:type IV pilin-like G/H family protein n=1 Tax=Nostoc sp. 'Lobaria pulmonaria (5183) cyanobiont' TaxID=1618022 RepID=UPI000CF30C67|nr:type IV pilin-like G/H family protein [Nostoc sp. 'Lobaria pulmonaria (5183) cyanobiont']AVH69730.1 general secretion pathway protein H [Nostoc sp. 'Lobaria pulmonaria (5183) cyanobiont']